MTWMLIAQDDVHGETLAIEGARYHHLVRVRRVTVGASLRAVLPDGRVLTAAVVEITRTTLIARVVGEVPAHGVSPCRITLCQAILKGEKMDLVVQKAVELGVMTLVPLVTRRTVPQWTDKPATERTERWQRIADAAAEQSERSLPLQVMPPQRFTASPAAHEISLLLHERRGESLAILAQQAPTATDIALYLGPEGGWDDTEVASLLAAGVRSIHLGPRILRAETATLAAVALVQFLWGDLGFAAE